MEHASRYVEDKDLKAALDDDESHSGGIGTPATRADVIEKLVHAGYMERQRPKHMGGLVERKPADDYAAHGDNRCTRCAELGDLYAGLQCGLSRPARRLDGQRRQRFAGGSSIVRANRG